MVQIICTSLQTDNHASTSPLNILQARCSFWRPTNSVKALKATCIKFTTKRQLSDVVTDSNNTTDTAIHTDCKQTRPQTSYVPGNHLVLHIPLVLQHLARDACDFRFVVEIAWKCIELLTAQLRIFALTISFSKTWWNVNGYLPIISVLWDQRTCLTAPVHNMLCDTFFSTIILPHPSR